MNQNETNDQTKGSNGVGVGVAPTILHEITMDNPSASDDYIKVMKKALSEYNFNANPPTTGKITAGQIKRPEYKSAMISRVSVPIRSNFGPNGHLEMTLQQPSDYVDFTLLLPQRQALEFSIHRKDIEALVGQLTLDKLAK